ncbi:MAG: nicotinic acid mononucleotide adenylyltransferase, partial [Anaerolineaceae bacterium]|nr:nicotinic acid mononucleotide adenylyltransferase [Anaerolineaceae bacterium]
PNDTIDLAMVQNEIPEISTKLSWIEAPLIDIASHEIRRRAKIRLPIRYYLPGRVYQLIRENNWYQ